MEMHSIPLEHANEGDILAEDVKNSRGIILVPKDCILNRYLKERLLRLGIQTIRVYPVEKETKLTVEEYSDLVYSFKEIYREILDGKELDYIKLNEICNVLTADNLQDNDVIRLLNNVKSLDEYTYTHSLNVAFYSVFIAKWLNSPAICLKEVAQAGLLHDIGKAFIPVDILNKKTRLSAEEFNVIRKHTVLGFESVHGLERLSEQVKEGVLLHHERINGSGYPYGLKGPMMNLCPKIVAVADVYDAMTQDRVYKKGVTPFEAFEMFLDEGVEMFDYDVLNIFLKNISVCFTGLNALLENDKQCEIVYLPPQDIVHPILFDGSEIINTATSNVKIKKVF